MLDWLDIEALKWFGFNEQLYKQGQHQHITIHQLTPGMRKKILSLRGKAGGLLTVTVHKKITEDEQVSLVNKTITL